MRRPLLLSFLAVASPHVVSRRSLLRSSALATSSLLAPASSSLAAAPEAALSYQAPQVYFYDEVTRDSALRLKRELLEAEAACVRLRADLSLASLPPVHLHIHSGGGSLSSGLHICDVMERLACPVHTFVEGTVASAASLISVCGTRRYMYKRSCLLVHQASIRLGDDLKNDELQDEAHNMALLSSTMLDVYRAHTPLTASEIRSLVRNERYLSAAQALACGLVDVVL